MAENTIQDEACFVDSEHQHKHLDSNITHSIHHTHCHSLQLNSPSHTQNTSHSTLQHPPPRLDFLTLLPTEIAIYILLQLGNLPHSLLNARLVSSSWQTLAQDPILWREIFLNSPNWNVRSLYPPPSLSPTPPHQSSSPVNPRVVRRLSQLLSQPLPSAPQSIPQHPHQLRSLDWLKLYRDRFILDRRWADGSQLTRSLKAHKDSIYCVQIYDQKIITGSRDRTVKIWNMKTGACTDTLTGHKGSVLCVRYDGRRMLTGSSDCQVFEWEETIGGRWEVRRRMIGHQSGVLDLRCNERVIVSCSKDTTVKIWGRVDGALERTITGHSGPVNALELCSGPLGRLEHPAEGGEEAGAGPATTGLLTASGDSTMKLWELETGRLVRSFEGHIRGLACLKLVEPHNIVVTGSNDETIKFWNLATGQCLRTLLGHSGLVRSLDIHLAQNRLVSGSYDRTIKVWDLATGNVLLDFRKGERRLVFDVKINLTSIVLVGHDSNVMILDFGHGLECDNFI